MAVFLVRLDGGEVSRISPTGHKMVDVDPTGTHALLWDSRQFINTRTLAWYRLNLSNGGLVRLPLDGREHESLCFGPTPDLLLFSRRARSRQTADIYAAQLAADATAVIRQWCVARDTAPATFPRWSPDGRRIAYIADPFYLGDDLETHVVRTYNVGLEDVAPADVYIAQEHEDVHPLVWFADSRRLLFHTTTGWKIADTEVGHLTDYTQFLLDQGHVSSGKLAWLSGLMPCPHGSDRVAVVMNVRKSARLMGHYIGTMRFDGSEFTQVTFDADQPVPYVFREQQQAYILGGE